MSRDLVRDFIADRDHLQCHPHGMFTIAMWIYKQLKIRHIHWYSDERIHHDPPVSKVYERFRTRNEICRTHISLHGTYPKEMLSLQTILDREKTRSILQMTYDIPPVTDNCKFERDTFDFKWFKPPWLFDPIPCSKKPLWNRTTIWAGRGGSRNSR